MAAYRYQQRVLDNGLTVATIVMPHLHSAQISLFARVGSRHESHETNGLSHFLEHMFFRGCEGFSDSTQLNTAIEDMGGVLDGFTSRDTSSYHASVHPTYTPDAIRIMGSMFLASTFKDLDIERGIILEEMLDAIDERGRLIDLDGIAHREAFKEHALGMPIEGSRKNVRRFTHECLDSHRRQFYGGRNLVLCVAGNIDARNCVRAIEEAFGPLRAGKRARDHAPPTPKGTSRLAYVRTDETQTRLRLSFRGPAQDHEDHTSLLLLRQIIDGGLSGRLQTELVEQQGLAYDVSAELESYSDCGLFSFELAVANRKLPYSIQKLGEFILNLVHYGVEEEELHRVRNRTRLSLELALDSPSELSHWYGESALFRKPVSFKQKLMQLQRVKSEDVLRVAQKYLRKERLTCAAVGGADLGILREARARLKTFLGELSCPAHL